jgi:hypothetical protein
MNTLKIVVVSTLFAAFAAGAAEFTQEQHLALAGDFKAKATAALEKVALHEAMARGGAPKASTQAMASHCERLIAQYRAEADEFAAAAAEEMRLATAN